MMNVIINADDFGLSAVVNEEIENALKHDWISSTTIMANSHYMKDVVRVYNDYPNKSFGVHLNVTEGPSLTKNEVFRKAGMIDDRGDFIRKNNFYMRVYDERIKNAIEMEWDAQINEVLSHGITISHLDGHHHCHTWHGFEAPLLSVMRKYGVKKVRRTFRDPFEPFMYSVEDAIAKALLHIGLNYSDDVKMSRFKRSARSHQDRLLNEKIMENSGMTFTNFFCAAESFMPHTKNLDNYYSCSFELMCHPGHPRYQREYEMLKTARFTEKGINVISYNDL